MTDLSRRDAMVALAAGGAVAAAAPARALSTADRRAAAKPIIDYLKSTAPQLLRRPFGPFKSPSIAPSLPGKTYSAELWDWDTMWTVRGLFATAKVLGDHAFAKQIAEHARGALTIFLGYQQADGRLPLVIRASDPNAGKVIGRNQAKPVMAQLALNVADETGDVTWLAPLFDKILRFHDAWVKANGTPSGLLVWGDDVSIGNDNDPTTFGRPFYSSANPLLNCFFYRDLKAAEELANRLGRPAAERDAIAKRAAGIRDAMQRHSWDTRDGFYYTADVQCVDRRAELIPPEIPRGMDMSWATIPLRLQTFTGFLPLWSGIATKEQAATLVERNYRADDRLRAAYGVRTLSKLEPMYAMDFSLNPSNWLGPVWIVSNYLVWRGLKDYGFNDLADDLADKTVRLLAGGLAAQGSLNEYYHPDSGAPLSHQGFMNWNLLVMEMIA